MNALYARRAKIKILYDDKDISEDLSSYLKSFDFNDVMDGEADDISITLEDMAELWESDWLPEKGAILKASIVLSNWQEEGEQELYLGRFEIDEIEVSGPPHEVKIKAVSVPDNNTLRGIEKNRSWEKVTLFEICKDISNEANMELLYDVVQDPNLDRAEQTEESDLEFLERLCKENGYALKISDNKVIVFDIVDYEAKEPVANINREGSFLVDYSITSKTREIYKSCHVKYTNTKAGKTIEYTFTPDEDKKGKTLEVNEQVENLAEAERLAKKKLREKNTEEVTLSLSLLGNIELLAGCTVNISGFHKFDGKYIITKGSHSISGGYKVGLDLRRCLNGY